MRRLLVIDDEVFVRDIIAMFLEPLGYEIVTVENGRRALEIFDPATFDGALTDLLMPGLDGLDVCRNLREKAGAGRDFPVWILTGTDTTEAAAAAAEIGARGVISKPVRWAELRAKLEREFAPRNESPA